jgi:hypothetical protein
MVCTFLKVYMEICSSFLFLQEQIKDIIIIIWKGVFWGKEEGGGVRSCQERLGQ